MNDLIGRTIDLARANGGALFVVAIIVLLSLVVSAALAQWPWLVGHADWFAYGGSVALLIPNASTLWFRYEVARKRKRLESTKFRRDEDRQRLESYASRLEALEQRFNAGEAIWYAVGLLLLSVGFGVRVF
jgi:hypothetical protein